MEFKTEVLSMYTVREENGLSTVLKSCTWREIATFEGTTSYHYQNTEFPSPSGDNYTSYENISHQQVIEWIYELVDINTIRQNLTEEIVNKRKPDTINENVLPWKVTSSTNLEFDRSQLFVLLHNESVVYGPSHWHSNILNDALKKLNIDFSLPEDKIAYETVCPTNIPYEVNENTKIYLAELTNSNYDASNVFVKPNNIVWNFETGKAIGTFVPIDEDIEAIKEKLRQDVTSNKESLETLGLEVEISEGRKDDINCGPLARNNLLFKYILMDDNSITNLRCRDGTFAELSKVEVKKVLDQLNAHHEKSLQWEADKYDEILNSSTIEELKNINTNYS